MARAAISFDDCAGDHYRDVAVDLLEKVKGQTLVQPRRKEADSAEDVVDSGPEAEKDPLAGLKGMSVDILHTEGDLLYGEILVGTFGDHEAALAAPPELVEVDDDDSNEGDGGEGGVSAFPRGAPTDLTGRAPARRFRFVLNLPESGALGALLVEDLSRSCPVDLIVGWLRRRGKSAGEIRLAELGAVSTAKERRDASRYWRPTATAAIDDQHFADMLSQGQLDRVELVRHSINSDGMRDVTDLRLTAPSPEALTPVEDLVGLAVRWYEQVKNRRQAAADEPKKRLSKDERKAATAEARLAKQQTDEEAAQEMAALLGESVADLGFDDGWLVLQDGERTKRISPSRISELFVYEISRERRPSSLEFYQHGRGRALRLASPLKLDLAWPPSISIMAEE